MDCTAIVQQWCKAHDTENIFVLGKNVSEFQFSK